MAKDSVEQALEALEARRDELVDEMQRILAAINALSGIATPGGGAVEATLTGTATGVVTLPQHLSVRQMLVRLLDEQDRDWSVAEVLSEYETRGTPIKGTNPDKNLRAALVEAQKAGQVERTGYGRYKSVKFNNPWVAAEQRLREAFPGADAPG